MRKLGLLFIAMMAAFTARAGQSGDFDYYVLSLGWTPSWCATTGDARDDGQCDAGQGFGFTLHGLWPQYEAGWPSDCHTPARPPTRAETRGMADIMGSSGLAWHEWRKHGTCSGLSAPAYFRAARDAYAGVRIPEVFRRLRKDIRLPPRVVEDAFIESNPALRPEMITITCDEGRIDEVRICLTRDLAPRPCAPDARRDCRMPGALMEKVR